MPPAAVRVPRLRAILLLALAASCATSAKRTETRFVEGALPQAGFRMVVADTAGRRDRLRALPQRRLTQGMRNGKVMYWYADLTGCGCAWVGNEAAYRHYDALAQGRDEVASGSADRKMLRTVESEEETPPDAWFWENIAPEAFPQ
jgi:hypothetical protein